jgi:hypothetical protein
MSIAENPFLRQHEARQMSGPFSLMARQHEHGVNQASTNERNACGMAE